MLPESYLSIISLHVCVPSIEFVLHRFFEMEYLWLSLVSLTNTYCSTHVGGSEHIYIYGWMGDAFS